MWNIGALQFLGKSALEWERLQQERDSKQAQDRQRETERRASLIPEQRQAEDAKDHLRKEVERERGLRVTWTWNVSGNNPI